MPEEIEFNPREEQEKVEEHLNHGEAHHTSWTRFIALSTALLAVIAAVAALQAGGLVNESLLEQSLAVQKQAEASDMWAYYQAKGIKANTSQQTADLLAVNAAQSHAAEKYHASAEKYKEEQKELDTKARELEKQRDEKGHLAQELMHRHHTFAYCVTFTQIAIALSAIAALTRRRSVWYVSIVVGLVGLFLLVSGYLQH